MSAPETAAQSLNPAEAKSRPALRAIFFLFLIVTLPAVIVLGKLNEPLQNPTAPQGVVSLELARTMDQQRKVLDSWTEPEQLRLAFSIGLDFLCVIVFIGTLAIGCLLLAEASRRHGNLGPKLGRGLAWALAIMGLFWLAQNVLLAAALFGHVAEASAQITYWCALLKFTVLTASLGYLCVWGIALLFRKWFGGRPPIENIAH
jgi:hypothetical protein